MIRRRLARVLGGVLHRIIIAIGGALVIAIIATVYLLDSRPETSAWHRTHLDAEYTADSTVTDFNGYLELEEKLFAQLEREIVAKTPTGPQNSLNRFSKGSLSDPGQWAQNWNRSYEMKADAARVSALLIHGLSDSPYSLRSLAQTLHRQGVAVLGLRVPGHGTVPSGLVHVSWQDMAGAVRLAVRHLDKANPGKPLFIIGYSNGGALAVEYTLSALQDSMLPKPSGVILLSPEIGVSPLAAFASGLRWLGKVLGLEKLSWSSIDPEYDPFKYNSFAINAGDLAYRITERIQDHLDTLEKTNRLEQMPPLLAFQSSVDATVTATALVENFFERLAPPDHELVLFDINRRPEVVAMLTKDPADTFKPMLANSTRGFKLTVVSNENAQSAQVVARTREHGKDKTDKDETRVQLLTSWPDDVYSVGHLALPFSPLDPLYGGPKAPPSPGIALGHLALRGESGVLRISPKSLLRMHWNPFYDYVESRIFRFMDLPAAARR